MSSGSSDSSVHPFLRRFAAASKISAALPSDLDGYAYNEWRAKQISLMMRDDTFFEAMAESVDVEVDYHP